MAKRRRGLGDGDFSVRSEQGVNADARAAIKAARGGNCRTALAHLYDAAPHIQSNAPTEKHRSDFRMASIIVGKLCAVDTKKRGPRYRSHAFQGAKVRRRRRRR